MYWKGQQYTISGSPCTAAEPKASSTVNSCAGAACQFVKQRGDEIEPQRTSRNAPDNNLDALLRPGLYEAPTCRRRAHVAIDVVHLACLKTLHHGRTRVLQLTAVIRHALAQGARTTSSRWRRYGSSYQGPWNEAGYWCCPSQTLGVSQSTASFVPQTSPSPCGFFP